MRFLGQVLVGPSDIARIRESRAMGDRFGGSTEQQRQLVFSESNSAYKKKWRERLLEQCCRLKHLPSCPLPTPSSPRLRPVRSWPSISSIVDIGRPVRKGIHLDNLVTASTAARWFPPTGCLAVGTSRKGWQPCRTFASPSSLRSPTYFRPRLQPKCSPRPC